MIEIKDKADCCGCEACVQICPKQCISFTPDKEGFNYPTVDIDICVDCGLCETVCPVITQEIKGEPLAVYAAKNPNEKIRKESSSGGVFTMLAEHVINQNGVVFGACWNENWEVVHDYVEKKEHLDKFRGSKYVQSRIGDNYKKVLNFLKEGRKVLFTGTSCQVSGLKRFLSKDYDNLLAVDFICHGVPSPMVWQQYLKELVNEKKIGTVKSINFRDKKYGWYNFCFSVTGTNHNYCEIATMDAYMRGFLRNVYLRRSCHRCPSKSFGSNSDITIADFWGLSNLHSNFDNDSGTNLVIVNSNKGNVIFNRIESTYIISDNRAFQYNSPLYYSTIAHNKRDAFFDAIKKTNNNDMIRTIKRITKDTLLVRLKSFVSRFLISLRIR